MNGQPTGTTVPPQAPPPVTPQTPGPPGPPGGDRNRMPWILAAVALVVAAVLGGVLVFSLASEPSEKSAKSSAKDGDSSDGVTLPVEPDGGPGDGAAPLSSGAISSPENGSPVRAELMDAARKELDLESQFYVLQIYVQGDGAVAELETVDYSSMHVLAFRNDGGWQAKWSGSVEDRAELESVGLGLSPELIGALDWAPPPTTEDAGSAMILLFAQETGFDAADFTHDVVALVKGSDGAWWAWGWVFPNEPNYEAEQLFIKKLKGSSVWETVDFGTGLAPSDLEGTAPADVIERFNACDT